MWWCPGRDLNRKRLEYHYTNLHGEIALKTEKLQNMKAF
jgi:hypothetical protein